jgi:hypothetical protein
MVCQFRPEDLRIPHESIIFYHLYAMYVKCCYIPKYLRHTIYVYCIYYYSHRICANHNRYIITILLAAINSFFCLVNHKTQFTLFEKYKNNMQIRNHCLVCQFLNIITIIKVQRPTWNFCFKYYTYMYYGCILYAKTYYFIK